MGGAESILPLPVEGDNDAVHAFDRFGMLY